jgi:alcohol dehydrogenase class IV
VLHRYLEIARLLTGNPSAGPGDGIRYLTELVQELNIPGLRTYGITPSDFPQIVEKAQNASSMKANPITLTADELIRILETAY